MRRYHLKCPLCGTEETVRIFLDNPETPSCVECEENIDLAQVKKDCQAWLDYIKEVDEMIALEKKNGDDNPKTKEEETKRA